MNEFANVPQGQNNIVTVAVLHKHLDRNNKPLVLGYNTENYIVAYGDESEVYPRTTQGLMHATAEYESCVSHDLMVQAGDF